MKRTLLVLLVGCSSSSSPPPGPITGTIAADQTWEGDVDVHGFVTIPAGVTITVAPGANVVAAPGTQLDVIGTLDVEGTKDAPATLSTPTEFWLGVQVEGTYTMHYGIQSGGGITANAPGATVTIADSVLSNALGDYLIMNDGAVDVDHTNLGAETGDNTHCNIHINGGTHLSFTHSTNAGSVFGLMFYAGSGDFSHSNWIGNVTDVEPGATGTGSFDGDYFPTGQPAGVQGSTFADLSPTRLSDAGPR